jgi:peptide/nickel transport system ATP-binding protein
VNSLLEVQGLDVTFRTRDGDVRAVRNLACELGPGETLGIVGESGSGKSTVALAILGLLPKNAHVAGSVTARGRQLLGLREQDLAQVRGGTIAYVPQDPLSSLNPSFTVGWQVAEPIWIRQRIGKEAAYRRATELLAAVGIPQPAEQARRYPHEFSGGMRQRAVIAIAMANDPDIIIADEPTTALDVTIQAQVLEALKAAREQTRASMILITHDLGIVAGMADRVMVMYAGKPVETGDVDDIFFRSRMPYTLGLLGSLPRLDAASPVPLQPIPGSPPSLIGLPPGCPFAPRCPVVYDRCLAEEPALLDVAAGHKAACHRSAELVAGAPIFAATWADTGKPDGKALLPQQAVRAGPLPGPGTAGQPVIGVTGLVKHFPIHRGKLVRRQVGEAHAVCGVSLELRPRETLGLVGESGCGKSTLARTILQLLRATSGSVVFQGRELTTLNRRELRPLRQEIQIVFQDPYASLDPRMRVGTILTEPLAIQAIGTRAEQRQRTRELLDEVGLSSNAADRFPHEFSGGQRQRIGLARALALSPKLIVADEPVSALDVSIRSQILNLMKRL